MFYLGSLELFFSFAPLNDIIKSKASNKNTMKKNFVGFATPKLHFRTLQYATAFIVSVVIMFGATIVVSATASTTISSVINPVISLLTTNGTVNVDVTPSASGAQTVASDTVTVSTSDANGYTLQLAETGASSNLVSGGDTIPSTSGTQTTPVAMSVNTWGYRVDGLGGFGAGPTSGQSSTAISGSIKFAAVPATGSPNTLKTTSSTASNDTLAVWYGVAANTSQPAGTYTNSVTYTATAN